MPFVLRLFATLLCLPTILAGTSVSAQPASAIDAVPTATLRATLTNDDCVSVDADGDPWDECGFQAWGMSTTGDRILTASAAGIVELWDRTGTRLKRIDWPDQPGGASGYPNARITVVGGVGVAVIHHNQVLIIDLAAGTELARRSLDLMLIDTLMPTTDGLLAAGKSRDWRMRAGEIALSDASFTPIDGLDDLRRARPTYFVTRGRAPFLLTRVGRDPAAVELPRSCMPIDDRYCSWRDIPGDTLHILDTETLVWRDIDLGGTVDGYEIVDVAHAGKYWALVRCGRVDYQTDNQRACVLSDVTTHTVLHNFRAESLKIIGALRSDGTPTLRIQRYGSRPDNRSFTVGFDGSVVDLGPALRVNLDAPRGGIITPSADELGQGIWLDRDGRPLARLPFVGTGCGFGWPNWMGNCAVSADGRTWLFGEAISQGSNSARDAGERNEIRLLLHDVPVPLAAQ